MPLKHDGMAPGVRTPIFYFGLLSIHCGTFYRLFHLSVSVALQDGNNFYISVGSCGACLNIQGVLWCSWIRGKKFYVHTFLINFLSYGVKWNFPLLSVMPTSCHFSGLGFSEYMKKPLLLKVSPNQYLYFLPWISLSVFYAFTESTLTLEIKMKQMAENIQIYHMWPKRT